MKYATLSSKGFSLIELMIVVVIIGILAAVAVPAYFNHVLRTHQSDAYHNLLDIKAAQEVHYSMYNAYADYGLLITSNTFTRLLSFTYADTEYYRYFATASTVSDAFTGWAEGKVSKLIGNSIRITDSADPCISSPGSLKQSLGLANCP